MCLPAQFTFLAAQKIFPRTFQRRSKPEQSVDPHQHLSAFNFLDRSVMHVSKLGEFLLRQSTSVANSAQVCAYLLGLCVALFWLGHLIYQGADCV